MWVFYRASKNCWRANLKSLLQHIKCIFRYVFRATKNKSKNKIFFECKNRRNDKIFSKNKFGNETSAFEMLWKSFGQKGWQRMGAGQMGCTGTIPRLRPLPAGILDSNRKFPIRLDLQVARYVCQNLFGFWSLKKLWLLCSLPLNIWDLQVQRRTSPDSSPDRQFCDFATRDAPNLQ